jgi:hypothetical protein
VAVPDDSTTAFTATAAVLAGNVSSCSDPLTYVEDSTAPSTQIDAMPLGQSTEANAQFGFSGSDTGGTGLASFECRLDSDQDAGWVPCTSPAQYASLADGAHKFEVRAIDQAGNIDASPASYGWNVDTTSEPVELQTPVRLLRIRYDVRAGTATLVFDVPSPGTLSASAPAPVGSSLSGGATKRQQALSWKRSHQIKPASISAGKAGQVELKIKLAPAGRRLLREKQRLKVRVRISFTAAGQDTVSRMLAITLKQRGGPSGQAPRNR